MTGIRAREPDSARPVGPRTGPDASAASGTALRGFIGRGGPAGDVAAVAAGAVLVVAAAVVGRLLLAGGVNLLLPFPRCSRSGCRTSARARRSPSSRRSRSSRTGPSLAATLPWRRLLPAAWTTATVWTLALALVDGWQRGWSSGSPAARSTCTTCRGSTGVREMLATFADHILTDQPVHWTTHVGAHPPGVFLVYVVLDRIGLGGGGAAGCW